MAYNEHSVAHKMRMLGPMKQLKFKGVMFILASEAEV